MELTLSLDQIEKELADILHEVEPTDVAVSVSILAAMIEVHKARELRALSSIEAIVTRMP